MAPNEPRQYTRRAFITNVGTAAVTTLAAMPLLNAVSASAATPSAGKTRVAFNTANLVARFTGYRFELKNWGEQVRTTIAHTDEKAWAKICSEIADAGFRDVEIWVAHVDPSVMTDQRAKAFRRILDDHGLEPIGLAAQLSDDTARVCQQLGIPACNGGIWSGGLADIQRVAKTTGIAFNYENHPEKSVDEILKKIGGGSPEVGVAVDTGWLATQGLDSAATIRALGKNLVRHVHIKDVKRAGAHETCPLGEGVANIPEALKALKAIGYTGTYAWEDEPEDRNPMEIARAMREYIEQRVG